MTNTPVCQNCGREIHWKAGDGWVHWTGSVWCNAHPSTGSCVLGPREDDPGPYVPRGDEHRKLYE